MSIPENIANRLRSEMEEQRTSLTEFSQEIGIGRSTLQGYLNGTSAPRSDTIELLSRYIGCTPAELISDDRGAATASITSRLEAELDRLHPKIRGDVYDIMKVILEKSIHLSKLLYELEDSQSKALHDAAAP